MCRRPIQRECLSDRWCLEQLPISSDEDFVFTYVPYFWYVEKKKEGAELRGISEGGGGSEPPAKTVNVLNLQIWKILVNSAPRENSLVFQQVKDFFFPFRILKTTSPRANK